MIYDGDPHGIWDDEPVWAGVRRTDEDVSAAGIYGYFEDREGRERLQFRPLMPDLDHEEAEIAADLIRERLKSEQHEMKRDQPDRDHDFSPDIDL